MTGVAATLRDLKAKLSRATEEIQSLRAKIAEKQEALLTARDAPVPLAEIEERIRLDVAATAACWLDERGRSVLAAFSGPETWNPRAPAPLRWSFSPVGPAYLQALPWGALCAAQPDAAVEILTAIVHQVDYEPGAPSADRPALIARLTAELAELERAELEIVDEAVAGGLAIDHRPEVIERRRNAERQREVEAQAIANRKSREAALDAQHATRTRR
jgi:hypothetical protein